MSIFMLDFSHSLVMILCHQYYKLEFSGVFNPLLSL